MSSRKRRGSSGRLPGSKRARGGNILEFVGYKYLGPGTRYSFGQVMPKNVLDYVAMYHDLLYLIDERRGGTSLSLYSSFSIYDEWMVSELQRLMGSMSRSERMDAEASIAALFLKPMSYDSKLSRSEMQNFLQGMMYDPSSWSSEEVLGLARVNADAYLENSESMNSLFMSPLDLEFIRLDDSVKPGFRRVLNLRPDYEVIANHESVPAKKSPPIFTPNESLRIPSLSDNRGWVNTILGGGIGIYTFPLVFW